MPKITAKQLSELNWEDIKNMKKDEAKAFLKEARNIYEKRSKSFEKNKSVFSATYENMKNFYSSNKQDSISKINKGDAQKELYRLTKFLKGESSTVSGARKIAYEQDKMIFGTKANGQPAHRMRKATREKFWAVYQEYLNTYKTADVLYQSKQIMQELGDMIDEGKKISVDMGTLEALHRSIQQPFKSMSDRAEEDVPNVYSGKWNTK